MSGNYIKDGEIDCYGNMDPQQFTVTQVAQVTGWCRLRACMWVRLGCCRGEFKHFHGTNYYYLC